MRILSFAVLLFVASGPVIAQDLPGAGASYLASKKVARQFGQATGVAITPLLGMSFTGAYNYFNASPEKRASLPWYNQPYFWGIGFSIIAFLWFGHRIPGIRRGFKLAKVWESKVSAVLAIPVVSQTIMAAMSEQPVPSAWFNPGEWLVPSLQASGSSGGVDIIGVAGTVLAAALCLITGAFVWLMFHTINVLVLVSPLSIVDWILKGFKALAIGFLVVGLLIDPWLGAGISLVYFLVAVLVAGWASRWLHFGSVVSTDFLFLRWRRKEVGENGVEAFSEAGTSLPPRTWGRICKEGDMIVFRFRPFRVLPSKYAVLKEPLWIAKGLLSPIIISETGQTVARLPPRFRGHENVIIGRLALAGEKEVGIRKGVSAAIQWIRSHVSPSQTVTA